MAYFDWEVQNVQPQPDYTLIITFATGEKKLYDCKPLLNHGVFKALNNIDFFMQAHSDGTTVVWNEDIDIAPESLYEKGVPIK